jgi:hypothetical protein
VTIGWLDTDCSVYISQSYFPAFSIRPMETCYGYYKAECLFFQRFSMHFSIPLTNLYLYLKTSSEGKKGVWIFTPSDITLYHCASSCWCSWRHCWAVHALRHGITCQKTYVFSNAGVQTSDLTSLRSSFTGQKESFTVHCIMFFAILFIMFY